MFPMGIPLSETGEDDQSEISTPDGCFQNALAYISTWAHPAWSDFTDPYHLAITRLWISNNRIAEALQKTTVVDLISDVETIAPGSHLVKYGNYRYSNTIVKDSDVIFPLAGGNDEPTKNSGQYSEACFHPLTVKITNNVHRDMEKHLTNLSCGSWLIAFEALLHDVRYAGIESLRHRWANTLVNACIDFIAVCRWNHLLLERIHKDMPFMINYDELQSVPNSVEELMSIFQFQVTQEPAGVEQLWEKLSSLRIRRLWYDKKAASVTTDLNPAVAYALGKSSPTVVLTNFLKTGMSRSEEIRHKSSEDLIGELEISVKSEALKEGTLDSLVPDQSLHTSSLLTNTGNSEEITLLTSNLLGANEVKTEMESNVCESQLRDQTIPKKEEVLKIENDDSDSTATERCLQDELIPHHIQHSGKRSPVTISKSPDASLPHGIHSADFFRQPANTSPKMNLKTTTYVTPQRRINATFLPPIMMQTTIENGHISRVTKLPVLRYPVISRQQTTMQQHQNGPIQGRKMNTMLGAPMVCISRIPQPGFQLPYNQNVFSPNCTISTPFQHTKPKMPPALIATKMAAIPTFLPCTTAPIYSQNISPLIFAQTISPRHLIPNSPSSLYSKIRPETLKHEFAQTISQRHLIPNSPSSLYSKMKPETLKHELVGRDAATSPLPPIQAKKFDAVSSGMPLNFSNDKTTVFQQSNKPQNLRQQYYPIPQIKQLTPIGQKVIRLPHPNVFPPQWPRMQFVSPTMRPVVETSTAVFRPVFNPVKYSPLTKCDVTKLILPPEIIRNNHADSKNGNQTLSWRKAQVMLAEKNSDVPKEVTTNREQPECNPTGLNFAKSQRPCARQLWRS